MNSITVCVDYADLLALTLPKNVKHFEQLLVVTTREDKETQDVCGAFWNQGVSMLLTDAFYENGAHFNKGLAMETGFDLFREALPADWLVVWDADIMMPDCMILDGITPGKLYRPLRKVMTVPAAYDDGIDWDTLPDGPESDRNEVGGYFQLFHPADPVLTNRRPWYGVNWTHAGGCDSDFQRLWLPEDKEILEGFRVLHLGEHGQNWHGRTPEKRAVHDAMMARRKEIGPGYWSHSESKKERV